MFGIGKKSVARRARQAVTAVLEPGETIHALAYARGQEGLDAMQFYVMPAVATSSWILATTNRRVLVFAGNQFNAARSTLAAAAPLSSVRAGEVDLERPMRSYVELVFEGVEKVRFLIPALWKQEATELIDQLRAAHVASG